MQYDFDDKSKLSKMEIEEQEKSSSLSEESNLSDPRFADDEQSDWPSNEYSSLKKNRKYGRTSLEKTSSFGMPNVNPFSMLPSSPSTSNFLWKVKKRRKNMNLPLNLPNNHFN